MGSGLAFAIYAGTGALCANVAETPAPSGISVGGGEKMSDVQQSIDGSVRGAAHGRDGGDQGRA